MSLDADSVTGPAAWDGIADRERDRLLDAAIDILRSRRYTFTEDEALAAVWEAGYDISTQSEARFALAREADGPHERQWRLTEQTLVNDRLLDALRSGDWDGRDLDAQLVALDSLDGTRYVFCPLDPRFAIDSTGRLELTDAEQNVDLADDIRIELDALAPALLTRWRDHGGAPWTVRQVTGCLSDLGWPRAAERESWLPVRAWLLHSPDVVRVGKDYWLPSDLTPSLPSGGRIQVLPVHPSSASPGMDSESGGEQSLPDLRLPEFALPDERLVPPGEVLTPRTVWTMALRTVHLVGGFIPVPSHARAAYPARAAAEGDLSVLPGVWFTDAERFWLWLDRAHDRLYGPGIADHLAWCEAGDLLQVEWASDTVVFRLAGHDVAVQQEESRLVDVDALAALRGGLGESYRQSLQAILADTSDGLSFADLVTALCDRQQHQVHRGTVRALLSAGGFVHRDGRWFPAPEPDGAARRLRRAIVTSVDTTDTDGPADDPAPRTIGTAFEVRLVARAAQTRLAEIVEQLRARTRHGDLQD